MNNFKKAIYQIVHQEEVVIEPQPTELALRSSSGYLTTEERNICAEVLAINCTIATQTSGDIITGDIVYESDGVTPFDGGASNSSTSAFYNLGLSFWTEVQGTRVCSIDNFGVISVNTICNI